MYEPVKVSVPDLIDLALAKEQMGVYFDDEDETVKIAVRAAQDHFEGYGGITGLAFLNGEWRQDFDEFEGSWLGGGVLRLLNWPVQSISEITYWNTDATEVETTLDAGVYRLGQDASGAYVTLNAGQSWPAVGLTRPGVSVTYVAGHGDTPESVPADIRWAVMAYARTLYSSREFTSSGMMIEVPLGLRHLINKYRRTGF